MFPQFCGMSKRTSKEVRKVILEVLKDGLAHSYGDLERQVGTNWMTIRNHIDDLILFNAVTKKEFDKHDQNGRPFVEITITKEGLILFKKLV